MDFYKNNDRIRIFNSRTWPKNEELRNIFMQIPFLNFIFLKINLMVLQIFFKKIGKE
jgi:hypothetical protein